tara:strand:- start:2054 stop:2317 length:264 start_codon:yes stop_codon:yes gene_type:complete
MKKNIHPENYRSCVFKDVSTDFAILTKSCAESNETIKWEDGNEYPLIKMEISSDSHPFYTGKTKLVDTAGRIDKFKTKYQSFKKYNK